MSTLTFTCPDALEFELARQSAAAGLSVNDFAFEALRRYLAAREFRTQRAALMSIAQALGIDSDSDVLDAGDDENTSASS